MRENLPFDDFVKEQFSEYSPNVPGHIWKNIIDKRKSKPKGFWVSMLSGKIVLISLIILMGGGTGWFLISSNNNSAADNIPATGNTAAEKNVVTDKPVNTSPASQEKNIAANRSASLSDNTKQQDLPATDNIPGQWNPDRSSHQNTLFKASNKAAIVNSGIDEYNSEMNKQENSSVLQHAREVSSTILYSPFRFNNARELSTKKMAGPLNIKLPDCPTLEKNAAGNKKYWEAYAGPDYAFESYKSYDDTASTNYLEKRKASTKFASAFSAGVRYTKVFNNGTSVRAGINYSQVNEKFLYFNPNEIKFVTVITTRVVIRAPGDTIYINDTLQYQQTGTRIKTTYNRYRNIDIPLAIGYELGNGRIHANINAGVIINIYSWYKGDLLDSLYQPVSITTGKGSSIYHFKNNIGVGFLGSISVYYKMTDNMHLLLEPYFRYNLSPMSKQNLNLQQKYNIAGLRAGVRVDLK